MNYDIDTRKTERHEYGISPSSVCPFVTAMLLTLLMAGLAAGMIYLSRAAAHSYADAAPYDTLKADIEKILSLRSIVRGIFPYLVLVVDIFLILVYLASIVAEAL